MRCVMHCVLIGSLLLAYPAAARSAAPTDQSDPPAKTKTTWAEIELKGAYPEGPQMPGLFGELTEGLADAIARLDKAASDDNVSGVVLRFNMPLLGWGKLNELRQAIDRVQSKGKKVYAWLPTPTSMDYLLACTCDEVVMPESGLLMLVGLRAEVDFYKGLFDKLGVQADMIRVGEFKSAAEPFTRTEMSAPFRREMEELLDDHYRQMVDAIAEGRGLERERVTAAIDSGPHTASAAKELGLIDRLAYEDELEDLLEKQHPQTELSIVRRYGKKAQDLDFSGLTGFVKLMNLMMGIPPAERRSLNPKIAVIHATGVIMPGRSTSDILGGTVLGSDTIVKAVRKASNDSTVKAIVLRVDSPGGSAVASDLMWRELDRCDKPLVVSMGDVAASGGYYISMAADTIFAEPGTLTGSIGVVGGKFALSGLFDKVGISTSVITRGKNTGVLSLLEPFSEGERKAMMKMLEDVYAQFTHKAAKGRKMEHAELEPLARGRVYTGAMAQKIGLVDKLGTLDDAVDHAKQLAGLKPEDKVDRLLLPPPVSPLEQLFGPIDPEARAASPQTRAVLNALSPELTEQLQNLSTVNLLSRQPVLLFMPYQIRVK